MFNGRLNNKCSKLWEVSLFLLNVLLIIYCSPQFICHPGIKKAIFVIKQGFWWSSVLKDVTEYVSACAVCARHKSSTQTSSELLQSLPTPRRPRSHIVIDFVTGLFMLLLACLLDTSPNQWSVRTTQSRIGRDFERDFVALYYSSME